MALCYRTRNCSQLDRKDADVGSRVSFAEMVLAIVLIVKYVQSESDRQEIRQLSSGKSVKKSNSLRELCPFLGENSPCSLWPLWLIQDVKFNDDGLVCSVHVRTKSIVLVCSITKIVMLEGID